MNLNYCYIKYNGLRDDDGSTYESWKNYSIWVNNSIGLNIQNIGPNITYINQAQADPLPLNWRMGFSYHILDDKFNKLSVNADMNKLLANDDFFLLRIITAWHDDPYRDEVRSIITNFGVEYDYLDLIALRAGYINDEEGEIKGLSFGFGVHHKFSGKYRLGVDMAFQRGGELTPYNKTFSYIYGGYKALIQYSYEVSPQSYYLITFLIGYH